MFISFVRIMIVKVLIYYVIMETGTLTVVEHIQDKGGSMGLFRRKKKEEEFKEENLTPVRANPEDAYELSDLDAPHVDVVTEAASSTYVEPDFIEVGLSEKTGEAEVIDTSNIPDPVGMEDEGIDIAAADVEADYVDADSNEGSLIEAPDAEWSHVGEDTQDTEGLNLDEVDFDQEMEEVPEERLPYGKYELKKLYQDIGEEYCKVYAECPEDAFAEKVALVNRLKVQTDEMKRKVENVCRSPFTFLLILLLSAQIALPFIHGVTKEAVIAAIPMGIIDLAVLLLFIQGLIRKVGKLSFNVINFLLTICLIVCYIPVFVTLILGIMMRLSDRVDLVGMATGIIVLSILFVVLNTVYWYGLKSTTTTAKTIVAGHLIRWKSSVFVIFLMILQILANIAYLAGFLLFKEKVVEMVGSMCAILDESFGIAKATSAVTEMLANYTIGKMELASTMLSILILLVSIIILSSVGRED